MPGVTYIHRMDLLHFLLSVVSYSLSSLCLYLQWCTAKYECFNTTGNNVGKWHFGFVGTIKRSVFTARFFNTVILTSHCLVNQLCQQL